MIDGAFHWNIYSLYMHTYAVSCNVCTGLWLHCVPFQKNKDDQTRTLRWVAPPKRSGCGGNKRRAQNPYVERPSSPDLRLRAERLEASCQGHLFQIIGPSEVHRAWCLERIHAGDYARGSVGVG